MKNLIKTIFMVVTLIILIITGCNKTRENPTTNNVIPVNGTQKEINVEQNGIGITFYLLNDQGEPTTILRQGEDFKFHLSIKNNMESKDTMYIPVGLGYGYIPDQFFVMTEEGDTIGRPFYFQGSDYILTKCPIIYPGDSFTLELPWTENREAWHICTLYAHGSKNSPLPIGIYYTSFSHKFCFRNASLPFPEKVQDLICTDTLYFKINFEVK